MSDLPTSFTLPYPVSVNGAFKLHNGKRLSKEYRAWRDAAGYKLRSQKPHRHKGKVLVDIDLVAPDRRIRDADNVLKAILDLLVRHAVIEDDSNRFMRRVSIGWEDEGEPSR
ncbi:hypothetical protein GCM10007989_13560 [Devosia pacifica]|uniref:Uncharacterized protein n=1 Tax=Devosia pacifica TaxID=1335967 RepID=A0A918VS42_9HYPH|nr:RusA family crossover junction endodeoxyribonuclease [Devosia pacifica]GHA19329.1 hypothetical protein GCM10007989_13560 [Devosia pacifica]